MQIYYVNSEENDVVDKLKILKNCGDEGGELTTYYSNEVELRYKLILGAGMYNVEQNYYLDDNFNYCTVLNKKYGSYDYSKRDALYYTFSEYWIDDDNVYIIDRMSWSSNIVTPLSNY